MESEEITFLYSYGDPDPDLVAVSGDPDSCFVTFHCYCEDVETALAFADDIRSICGNQIERDGNFLYVSVYDCDLDRAIQEFDDLGFCTREG